MHHLLECFVCLKKQILAADKYFFCERYETYIEHPFSTARLQEFICLVKKPQRVRDAGGYGIFCDHDGNCFHGAKIVIMNVAIAPSKCRNIHIDSGIKDIVLFQKTTKKMRLDPYLNFNGNTEEVFNFYKKVFKRDFTSLMRFADMPGGDKMSPADKTKILHVALPVGDSVLMGTDVLDSMNQKISTGDNFSISITVDSEAEATRIFDALSDRGDVIMPLGKEFWSDLFGICKDPFGIQWMINFKANQK